jgi:hypothetical protein
MGRRVVAAARDEGATRFWVIDVEGGGGQYNLWATNPTYVADIPLFSTTEPGAAGQPAWAFVEGPTSPLRRTVNGKGLADNTLVEFRPRHIVSGASLDAAGLREGDLVINGVPIREPIEEDDQVSPRGEAVVSAIATAFVINEVTAETGVRARRNPTRVEGGPVVGGPLEGGDLGEAPGLQINGVHIPFEGEVDPDDPAPLVAAINASFAVTRVEASTRTVDDGGAQSTRLALTAVDGRNILIQVTEAAALSTGLGAGLFYGSVRLDDDAPFTLGGANPGRAGLPAGESVVDPSLWRITARAVRCGARP